MDYVQIALSARLAHGDLLAADEALETGVAGHGLSMILIKQLLITCANVNDLEVISRVLYREHPELSEIFTPHRRSFEFIKYIRNIAVGHINPALCRKAVEWRPEINAVLTSPQPGADIFLSYAVLETAINTYVYEDRHKFFESDTDLAYPPDRVRFLNFLGRTVHVGINFCDALAQAAIARADLPDFGENVFELAVKAGRTDFKFITRKGESS